MSELARNTPGWTRVAFGDVVRQVKDRVDVEQSGLERYVAGEHMDTDDLHIRRWGEVGDGYLGPAFHMRFKPSHVLYGSRRTYLRKVAVADFEGITANTTYVLEPKDRNVLLPELLPFIVQTESFTQYSVRESKGSVNPYVNFSDIARYEFGLPPIREQRRFVDALRSADLVREGLLNLCNANRSLLTSLAARAFCQSLWPEHRLGSLLDFASDGPFGSKIKTEHYVRAGVRVIRLNNIGENRFDDADKAFLSMEYFFSSLKSYEVRAGDVVVAGLGDDNIPAGRACVVPHSLGPAINKADCFCLRPGQTLVPQFLAYFLNSPRGLAQSAAYSQGTTRLRLNLGNIKNMSVPLPPVAVQEKIVARMGSLQNVGEQVAVRRELCTAFRKKLLQSLMDNGSGI